MAENISWKLEEFVDSLVVELDKTRETLAVKAINKPLTYTVKELNLDLNIFPSYDGDEVSFVTARPGQQGASKVSIQLNSITDQQVRATTQTPVSKGDVTLDDAKVDPSTRKKLRRLGVTSIGDLESIEHRNIDLKRVTDSPDIDYSKLANLLQKARRDKAPPRVTSASLSAEQGLGPCLVINGENLAVNPDFPPVAVVDSALAEVVDSSPDRVAIRLAAGWPRAEVTQLVLTMDPFAVLKLNLRTPT
jgi:hypothetical protein